jgi:hypothetical protein
MAPQPRRGMRSASSEANHVPRFDEKYETPKWRTFWLLASFALLIGIGVVTVLLPELEDESQTAEEAASSQALQE